MDLKEAIKYAFKCNSDKKEMHIDDIALYVSTSISEYKDEKIESLKKRIIGVIANDLKRKVKGKTVDNKDSVFIRVHNKKGGYKKGIYSVRPKKKTKPVIISQPILPGFDEPRFVEKKKAIDVFNGLTTSHIGKGGEFAVVSELLFRGFNANIMTVDDGIDISASKKGKFYFIQVKTTSYKDEGFSVNVDKNSYSRYNDSNIFYVVVIRYCREGVMSNQYLIFGAKDIERFNNIDLIGNNEKNYLLKFKQIDGDVFVVRGNKSESVLKTHLNNFDWIK